MDPDLKSYLTSALTVMIISTILVLVFTDFAIEECILPLVSIFALYPLVVLSLYMFLEGKNYRWVNGMDWEAMTEQGRINAVSYWGAYMLVGSIVMIFAINIMLGYMLFGIFLIILGVIIMMIPVVRRETAESKQFIARPKGTKVALFIAVTLLAMVPAVGLAGAEMTSDTVIVEFTDEGVHISAPMVGRTFKYDEIEQLELDPNFDKGKRLIGYGTPYICSGTFKNDALGSYTLMSYTKVKPCVFFLYGERYFAFNQLTDELTQQAYEELLSKVAKG